LYVDNWRWQRVPFYLRTGKRLARQLSEEAAWVLLMPVLEVWANNRPRNFPNYAAGSWGPKEADDLLKRDVNEWRRPK
jgi:glucose-6-phosphate 1-dehydrogenase